MQRVFLGERELRGRTREGDGGAEPAVRGDHCAGVVNFLARVQSVAAIGEERGAGMFDEQDCGAAGEAAEITDVGKMSDEESVGMESGKRKPEPMDPAPG